MNRRTVLAGAALAVGFPLAGCVQDGGGPGSDDTETSGRETGTPTTADESDVGTPTPLDEGTTDEGGTPSGDKGAVDVRDVTVIPEVVTLDSPDSYGTYGSRNEQYAIADVAVESPSRRDFMFETGDEIFYPTTEIGELRGWLENFGDSYERGDGEGWVAFRVPNPLEADEAVLTWDGGRYALGESTLEDLARSPTTFEVRRFETPDQVAPGDTIHLSLAVENVGDASETFVGALNRVGPKVAYAPETSIWLDVEPGETAEWEYTYDLDRVFDREDPSVRFKLNWRNGRLSRSVDIE